MARTLPHPLTTRLAALGTVAGSMWVVHLLDLLVPGSGSPLGYGIIPRTWIGLQGIPVAPLIHGNVQHLAANTIPLLVLGALVLFRGVGEFLFVVLTCTFVAGAGTWLFGTGGAQHIGASGVVFGLFGFLLFRTVYDRRWSSAVITIVVAVLYGTAMARSILPEYGISWSGHFFGFLGGIAAARMRYPSGRRARLR